MGIISKGDRWGRVRCAANLRKGLEFLWWMSACEQLHWCMHMCRTWHCRHLATWSLHFLQVRT